jgi:hypothetical protein
MLPTYPGLLMMWPPRPTRSDVRVAFDQLTRRLDRTLTPLYVVADLRAKPQLPMRTTIREALLGPYNHPMLAAWLVIGTTPVARVIAQSLGSITGRHNVYWFKDDEEVLAYLHLHHGHPSAQV